MAKLNFKYATMNSGKTLDLIRTAHNYEENGYKVIILKPAIDTKGETYIESRIGLKRKVNYLIGKEDNIIHTIANELANALLYNFIHIYPMTILSVFSQFICSC